MKSKTINEIKTDKIKFLYPLFLLLLLSAFALAATYDEAKTALAAAEKNVDDMEAEGFTTTQIKSLLDQARGFFSKGDYDSTVALTNQVNATREKAFFLRGEFNRLDEEIFELSKLADTTAIKEKLRSASAEFYKENYAGAEEFLKQAEDELEKLKSQVSLRQATQEESGFIKFVRDNVFLVIFLLIIIFLYFVVLHKRVEKKKKYHRLQQLDEMEKNTKNAIAKAQDDYFIKKKIDGHEYRSKMNTFRKHLAEIKRKRLIISRELKKGKEKQNK